ncbi:MAG: hypothetical protein JWM95_4004 [Gemmatimonadetes bacterium]|nr:hypothetical protein [Gemmatimonadota bacterium]
MRKRWALLQCCALALAAGCQASLTDVGSQMTPAPARHAEGEDEPYAGDADGMVSGSSVVSRYAHTARVSTTVTNTNHGFQAPSAEAWGYANLTQWMSGSTVVYATSTTAVWCATVASWTCDSGFTQIAEGYNCAISGWSASASVRTSHEAIWNNVRGKVISTARDDCGNPPSGQDMYATGYGGVTGGSPTQGSGCYEWWHYDGHEWAYKGLVGDCE